MSFFEKVGLGRSRSAKSAKERLQLVLVHDRAGISPGKLEVLKDDLIDVISRHLEIDHADPRSRSTAPCGRYSTRPLAPATKKRPLNDASTPYLASL